MPLSADAAVEQAELLKNMQESEREQLDVVRQYVRGRQALPAVIPSAAPREVKVMAQIARVNICKIVVDSLTQSMYVDGFRADKESDNALVWGAWQKNRLDARQTGIHRASFTYGTSYAVVLPGDPLPVIRGVSPRMMTAAYGEDPDWPVFALERLSMAPDGSQLWRLYDDTSIYYLGEKTVNTAEGGKARAFTFIEQRDHNMGVTPVVRFVDEDDLDAECDVEAGDSITGVPQHPVLGGQVTPLMPIQDQIDLTTFNLLVAQHYNGFRQRWILGWTADSESEKMKAAASQIWTFDDHPDEVKLGEFSQTELSGYIDSRESSLRHGATLSQTPVHELIGELVNLSAEALTAAEAGKDRKVAERQTLSGEAWEQTLWLTGRLMNVEVPDDAQVRWRDTSARSFAATVDGLGKLTQMLGIPPQELWHMVPGTTPQDIENWKLAAQNGDSFAFLADMLQRQGAPTGDPAPING